MWPFRRCQSEIDWGKFFDLPPATRKERLLEECKRRGVSIHTNDANETSSGAYSIMRSIASEAELEHRLIAKLTINQTARANYIAVLSLVVSLAALVISVCKEVMGIKLPL